MIFIIYNNLWSNDNIKNYIINIHYNWIVIVDSKLYGYFF